MAIIWNAVLNAGRRGDVAGCQNIIWQHNGYGDSLVVLRQIQTMNFVRVDHDGLALQLVKTLVVNDEIAVLTADDVRKFKRLMPVA